MHPAFPSLRSAASARGERVLAVPRLWLLHRCRSILVRVPVLFVVFYPLYPPVQPAVSMEVPSTFVDATFSHEVMRDPVSTPQGHTFERVDIIEWIRIKGTCPLTREPLSLADLAPNRALRCVAGAAPCSSTGAAAFICLHPRPRTCRARAEALRPASRFVMLPLPPPPPPPRLATLTHAP